ncbi:hypothetical protein [Saccharospirillum mangrovi]|uniref:hypothetical protein n=1 Tax=Saccharospirillum mangrovi TaxID=2161747 RepID=UPI0018E56E64|nr:hypothetical protein [Saccharospirillum mangrovi]
MTTNDAFAAFLEQSVLPAELIDFRESLYQPLTDWLLRRRPRILGIQGTQGSGKSTLAAVLKWQLEQHGLSVAILSIDDLYLPLAGRQRLAQERHPLLATRGVPGTHDLALGEAILHWVRLGKGPKALPRFDKSRDDRRPEADWPVLPQPPDMLIFEGWCIGLSAEPETALAEPINALERRDDAQGEWRRYVNAQLAGPYQRLFAALDALIVLRAPGFEQVFNWRRRQEEGLRTRGGSGVMNDDQLRRFIQHYERLTRHGLATLGERADVLIPLDDQQRPGQPQWREPTV